MTAAPSPRQINDALDAALAAGFADGTLGTSHRGLPVQVIIKVDLNDLIREAGFATTAIGTLLPIPDLIGDVGEVQPWLAIFKDHTAVPLYFKCETLGNPRTTSRLLRPPRRRSLFRTRLRSTRYPGRTPSRPVIGPKAVSPISTTSHPPAHDTTAWSATSPASTPPTLSAPDLTKAAASGDSTPNPGAGGRQEVDL